MELNKEPTEHLEGANRPPIIVAEETEISQKELQQEEEVQKEKAKKEKEAKKEPPQEKNTPEKPTQPNQPLRYSDERQHIPRAST